jgi:hypothetical protein
MGYMKTDKENHNLKENSLLDHLLCSVYIILFLIMILVLDLWRNMSVVTE